MFLDAEGFKNSWFFRTSQSSVIKAPGLYAPNVLIAETVSNL